MKIITVIGARPQFVKAAMLSKAIAEHNAASPQEVVEEKLLHTGQHYDYEMSEVFFQELGIPAPAWNLGCTGSPEAMRDRIRPILEAEQPDFVVVYGDTNSTAGGAMAAHDAGLPLVHIEAGLRSFNAEQPEERNRILTDRLSDVLFCPTRTAVEHLNREGCKGKILQVGDIMYDAAMCFGSQGEDVLQSLDIRKPYILATVHRAENTDKIENLREILRALGRIDHSIVWPLHPRTRKVIWENPELSRLLNESGVRVIDNQGYCEMAALEAHAQLILTDSGGVQKEAYFHRVPCVTMREETEWVETVEAGWNTLTGAHAERIVEAVATARTPQTTIEDYGDGHTAEKILKELIGTGKTSSSSNSSNSSSSSSSSDSSSSSETSDSSGSSETSDSSNSSDSRETSETSDSSGSSKASRILIISDPIAPPSYAPRVMSMCRYLQEAGHDVVLEAGELPQKRSLWQFVGDKLWQANDRVFAKQLLAKYEKGRFDVILCTTYYYFPLLTAERLSRAWDIPYVVDLRDIVEQWGTASYFTTKLPKLLGLEKILAKWYEDKNLRMRNRVMAGAQAVTTISPWHRDHLQSLTKTPVHLICNGYDEAEMHFEARKSEVFSVAFIGRFISLNLRQPHLLFAAMGEMLKASEIEKSEWRLDFYAEAEKEQEVRALAREYGAEELLQWHGFVSRSELNDIMAESSVLLALGCPPKDGQHGILGTKVFEAIGVEKPLLLVPSDEDSLAQLIRETGIGCAARNVEEVKTFLRERYAEWKQNGYTRITIEGKQDYSRRKEAEQMEKILTA